MKKLRFILIGIILIFVNPTKSAQALEDYKPQSINVLHYQFNLKLSDESNEIFGKTEVSLQFLEEDMNGFHLDFESKKMFIDSIIQNGTNIDFEHKNNQLNINIIETSKIGELLSFNIYYHGTPTDGLIISENKFHERTFFGDNWPNRAKQWLPVVDHPSDKATCEFIITAPSHYKVVSNGFLVDETDLSETIKRTHWKEDVPISTKVMVFGAARFALRNLYSKSGISIQSWVFPQDTNSLFDNLDQAPKVMDFFEKYFGNYAYEKLANVQSKTRYGGMENAGSIFYAEHRIYNKQKCEDLLAHEIAHQWFGNSVSECDWKHIWISEGFATYADHLYLEHTYGREDFIAKMKKDRDAIFAFHKANPKSTVVDANVKNLLQLLNKNTYEKGSWTLHMLRYMIGEDVFWKLIQTYYQKFKERNACTEDFVNMVEEITSDNYQWFFDQWLYRPELPQIKGWWKYNEKSNKLTIDLKQLQAKNFCFKLAIEIAIYSTEDEKAIIKKIMLDEKAESFTFELDYAPVKVILDPNTWVLMNVDFEKY